MDYDNTPTFSNGVTLNADGTITVPAGVTDFTVTYPTLDDNLADDGETTTVTVDTVTGTGTINDEDGTDPSNPVEGVTIALTGSSSVTEGTDATYTVTVSEPVVDAMTVDVTYDYVSASTGDITTATTQVTIPAGQSTADFTVGTVEDNIDENDEIFNVVISNPTSGGFESVEITNDRVATTIVDNDTATLAVSNTEATEGGDLTHTVTLSNPNAEDTTYDFSITGGTATEGVDYDNTPTLAMESRLMQMAPSPYRLG